MKNHVQVRMLNRISICLGPTCPCLFLVSEKGHDTVPLPWCYMPKVHSGWNNEPIRREMTLLWTNEIVEMLIIWGMISVQLLNGSSWREKSVNNTQTTPSCWTRHGNRIVLVETSAPNHLSEILCLAQIRVSSAKRDRPTIGSITYPWRGNKVLHLTALLRRHPSGTFIRNKVHPPPYDQRFKSSFYPDVLIFGMISVSNCDKHEK